MLKVNIFSAQFALIVTLLFVPLVISASVRTELLIRALDGSESCSYILTPSSRIVFSDEQLVVMEENVRTFAYPLSKLGRYELIVSDDTSAIKDPTVQSNNLLMNFSANKLTLSGNDRGGVLSVMSVNGVIHYSEVIDADERREIDLSQLVPGVYVATYLDENLKIVVQ